MTNTMSMNSRQSINAQNRAKQFGVFFLVVQKIYIFWGGRKWEFNLLQKLLILNPGHIAIFRWNIFGTSKNVTKY